MLHLLVLPKMYHCLKVSLSFSPQLGIRIQTGYPQVSAALTPSLRAVKVSMTLTRFADAHNFTCGKQSEDESHYECINLIHADLSFHIRENGDRHIHEQRASS